MPLSRGSFRLLSSSIRFSLHTPDLFSTLNEGISIAPTIFHQPLRRLTAETFTLIIAKQMPSFHVFTLFRLFTAPFLDAAESR